MTKRFVIASYVIAAIVIAVAWVSVQNLIDGLNKRLGTQEQTIIVQRRTILEKDEQIDWTWHQRQLVAIALEKCRESRMAQPQTAIGAK